MRKIGVVTGTRAEYGLSRSIFRAIDRRPDLELAVIVTGMHLMEEFGKSLRLIEEDGFPIAWVTGVTQAGDSGSAMAETLGRHVISLTEAFQEIKPDIALVLTDLGHTLAAAIAAAHMNIPVAHVHGGDVSGGIDELIRHATSKFSHIHFPGSPLSAERLRKMGEEPWRIFSFGAPGIDEIRQTKFLERSALYSKYGLKVGEAFLLLVQHPVTPEGDPRREIEETIQGVKPLAMQTIIIYPNADAGGRIIIEAYDKLKEDPSFGIYKNLPREDYLSLMQHAACIIGNSSSAIIEAPYFALPAVNIGPRQRNRERAGNVIDVGYDRREIAEALKKAISEEFVKSLKGIKSPYGEGTAGVKIAQVLGEIEINDRLLNKVLTY